MSEVGAEKLKKIQRDNLDYTIFPWVVQSQHTPVVMAGGSGTRFWDPSGKEYLDFASQLVCVNVGHEHPKVVKAIQEQAAKVCYCTPTIATEARGELGRLIAEVTPGDLKKTFFTLGGSDANDTAIKLARMVTGRQKVISRYRSYHGSTFGATTVSGDPRRLPFEPGIPGIVRVFDPYCYRCVFGKSRGQCGLECVSHIEEVLKLEGPDNVAAVMVEAITGTNGVHVPPPEYMPALRDLCKAYDVLFVVDEVMTGWGRTGEWFAVNHWGVVPDMMTTAKGITSGSVPMGAVIVGDKISRALDDEYLAHGFTYGSHALACAAAVACINAYKEDDLIANSRRMGLLMQSLLAELPARHVSIGDVRSIGLFAALELVTDRKTKAPMGSASDMRVITKITRFLLDRGIFAFGRINNLVLAPPLCVTEDELRRGIALFDEALTIADEEVGR